MSIHCNVIRDLLPLYIDGVCSEESTALVEAHLQSCEACRQLSVELRTQVELPAGEPDLQGKRVFRELCRTIFAVATALLVILGGFVVNLEGAVFGGPAGPGQFIATLLYVIFWGVFTITAKKYRTLLNVSFVVAVLTTFSGVCSLVCRLVHWGWILAALASVAASVPFYGLRFVMGWTQLYAVVSVIGVIWLSYTGFLRRKMKHAQEA